MKKSLFVTVLVVLIQLTVFSQNESFVPGWYIIQSEATYSVVMPSSNDMIQNEDGSYTYPNYDDLPMAAGEVVLAFDLNKDKYYCFDPMGRMVVFNGANSLVKAPLVVGCSVGLMNESIQLIGGEELSEGSYYWIVGQDLSKSTVTIMINKNQKLEIPQTKITLLTATIRQIMKNDTYKPVN